MPHPELHREDIKAALRKRHGTLVAFEVKRSLPRGSVKDVLRGRAVSQTERAISADLKIELHRLFPRRYDAKASSRSAKVDNTSQKRDAQRQIAEAV
ncbi:MAG: helix-turn-helix domain-containing protein [Caulobacter sp.]|nr:helix-turn-helix domain-containing protein [Caulobacter sp.]